MTAVSANQPGPVPPSDIVISNGDERKDKANHGRRFCDITKKVASLVLCSAFKGSLVGLGIISLAAVILGIVLLLNPTGFGIGNALGAQFVVGGVALGALVATTVASLASHAALITIGGAIGLGATAAGAACLSIIKECGKDDFKDDIDPFTDKKLSGTPIKTQDLSEDDRTVDIKKDEQ